MAGEFFIRKLSAILLILPGAASAALFSWDNGVTSIDSIIVSQPSAGQVIFDDFVIDTPTTLTNVLFTGGYNRSSGRPENLVIRIHSDTGDHPNLGEFVDVFTGTPTSKTFIGVASNGSAVYEYSVDIDSTLTIGTSWISIFSSNSDRPTERWVWVHELIPGTGNEHHLNLVTNRLTGSSSASDFQLAGTTVPIPSTAPLFGIGLSFFGYLGWRKKKQATAWGGTCCGNVAKNRPFAQ